MCEGLEDDEKYLSQEIQNNVRKLKEEIKDYCTIKMCSRSDLRVLIPLLEKFIQIKNKNIPCDRYFMVVHEQESTEVHHGYYSGVTENYSFVAAVIQLFVSFEKKIKFPLTLPDHEFRFVFDDYGKNCCLKSMIEKYQSYIGESTSEQRGNVLRFLEYFVFETSVPIRMYTSLLKRTCVQVENRCTSAGRDAVCVILNVSSFDEDSLPMSLSAIMRKCVVFNNSFRCKKQTTVDFSEVVFFSLPKILLFYIDGKETSLNGYPIESEFELDLKDFYKGTSELQSTIYELLSVVTFEQTLVNDGCPFSSRVCTYCCLSQRIIMGEKKWFEYRSDEYKIVHEKHLNDKILKGVLFLYSISNVV